MLIGHLYIITSMPYSATVTHNWTSCNSPDYIFLRSKPICEIQENLHLGKITRNMVYYIIPFTLSQIYSYSVANIYLLCLNHVWYIGGKSTEHNASIIGINCQRNWQMYIKHMFCTGLWDFNESAVMTLSK